MKEKPDAKDVGSSDSLAPTAQVIPESPEVSAASAANKARTRQDALEIVSQKLGIGVRNSLDLVAHRCAMNRPDLIAEDYKLFVDRLREAHAILKDQIEGLPEL
jgi:hypothetical protein